MSCLSRYLLRQTLIPLVMFTLVLSVIVWLTQSLQMLDLVINRHQSAGTFLLVTIYILPSLLAVIIPFATFCATLYALHRLSTDSELIIMWSAGVSTWTVVRPVLFVAAGAALTTLIINLYLMPAGYRAMKDMVYEIRADIATSLIRDGAFTNPSKGLTVYNRETLKSGELRGLLVHVSHKSEGPTTYLAERGRFLNTKDGPRLIMANGSVQQLSKDHKLSLLFFDEYILDLSPYTARAHAIQRDLSERYLHELFRPDMKKSWVRKNIHRLYAEGHNRLASPLYNFSLVMIALVSLLKAGFSRHGYTLRITLALTLGLVVRLIGFGLQSLASQAPVMAIYMYVFPLAVIAICAYMLQDQTVSKQRHINRSVMAAQGS